MKQGKKKIMRSAVILLIVAAIIFFIGNRLLLYIDGQKKKAVPGNAVKYDIENTAVREDSPLRGMKILFLGSSVTYGAAAQGVSFADYLEKQDGIDAVKEAVSGTTMTDEWSLNSFLNWGDGGSYVSRLEKMDKDDNFDAVICQLSTNDATAGKALGEISNSKNPETFDTKTITGAIEYIISYSQETWNCPVIFYTGAYFENDAYQKMVYRLKELQDKWQFGIIDLYDDTEFNSISQKDYELYMYDEIHPTKAGYLKWWTPAIETYLSGYFTQSQSVRHSA